MEVYRTAFGLGECSATNGCHHFVAQDGSNHLPHKDPAWSAETAIDLDMASAICPKCSLLVIEAKDDSIRNLSAALAEGEWLDTTPQYIYAHRAQLNAIAASTSALQAGLGSPNGVGGF